MQFLTTTSEGYISLFFTLALMLVLLYFMIYRPQKKQEKKDAAMRSSWRSAIRSPPSVVSLAALSPSRMTPLFWRPALTA